MLDNAIIICVRIPEGLVHGLETRFDFPTTSLGSATARILKLADFTSRADSRYYPWPRQEHCYLADLMVRRQGLYQVVYA